jgi:NADH:ubiquinone oxidoreductase subunit C
VEKAVAEAHAAPFLHASGARPSRVTTFGHEMTYEVPVGSLPLAFDLILNHSGLLQQTLVDIAVADHPLSVARFQVNYIFSSLRLNSRLVVHTQSTEAAPLPSLTAWFPSANWIEREVWDMYGVFFTDHPDLRRILSDYGFSGFPLRKDFPLSGFYDVYYDDSTKLLAHADVEIAQQNRRQALA